MTINPYSAPNAALGEKADEAKKPISFLIMQIFLIPSALLLLVFGLMLPLYTPDGSSAPGGMGKYIAAAIFLLLFAWAAAILITAYRRKPVVRWLGGAAIGVFILGALSELIAGNGFERGTEAYRFGQLIGRMLVIGLECYWLYAFAFSAKARRYLGLQ
ncbi:hypothetical protein KY495_06990 [Massilia sp. PAMC28688]|uniref:hypothetical protein n=1 Tax=Massilia sp. PAMC28688 TaxID=2861283 RepID=UPI001C628F58|nr:hypothetical protein [Massilia sp. PAMC28688]QYF94916.1 hypothetical protein KY495_06990 [Massilia sp. PAMC28688]